MAIWRRPSTSVTMETVPFERETRVDKFVRRCETWGLKTDSSTVSSATDWDWICSTMSKTFVITAGLTFVAMRQSYTFGRTALSYRTRYMAYS